MPSRAARLLVVVLAALAGGVIGYALAPPPPPGPRTLVLPYPHHVPKTPGGVSLRFAMIQDVLHERFAHHGRAYYTERNRLARDELAKLDVGERYFALMDDLGAGLDRLGDDDEAVRVLRDKLMKQADRGVTGRDLYTTYANLGTFLIHGNFRVATAGDEAAREQLREGLDFIRQAIEVNPDAHFGREQWQAVVVEFLLAAIDRPDLLRTFDLIGNRLDKEIDPRELRVFHRDFSPAVLGLPRRKVLDDAISMEVRENLRRAIAWSGAESDWRDDLIPSHPKPVPFDEPVLGIIGMWRQGGGANPHFALCLGETMLRVGQRYLAWSAFERAQRLADRFRPDPDMQQFLRDHCRRRQKMLEEQLPVEDVAELRPRFDAELAYGERYQKDYQQYEADQISKGRSIDDPHFYDAFFAGRLPIASPVGPEDELLVEDGQFRLENIGVTWRFGLTLLGAGVGALAAACGMRRRRRAPAVE